MYTLATVITVITALLAVSAQQYQQQQQDDGNYVDDYSQYSEQSVEPNPRSYASQDIPARQSAAAPNPKPASAPVAILKQINRHNEDGSYTYGFEGADGSFKIETKLPTGDVRGKYGFIDDTGKVRVVEYGANQYGFQPVGDGITVAPPTLIDETTNKEAVQVQNYQQDYDYQQQEQQQPVALPAARPAYQAPVQSHTQTVYAPAQVAPSRPALPKQPIFTTAAAAAVPQAPRQSQLLQQGTVYEEPAPASQLYNQGPAQFSPAPVQERRSQPQPRSDGGILDQLARDYALPDGVAPPLHDISFGYY